MINRTAAKQARVSHWGVATLLLIGQGCTKIPSTPVDDASRADGRKFCSTVVDAATTDSSQYSIWGITSVGAGTAAVATGSIIGPDDGGSNIVQKQRGLLVATGGLVAIGVGVYLLGRSDAASKAASEANAALVQDPSDTFATCVQAKSAWISSRTDSNASFIAAMKQVRAAQDSAAKAKQEAALAKKSAAESQEEAKKARKEAADAKKAADDVLRAIAPK